MVPKCCENIAQIFITHDDGSLFIAICENRYHGRERLFGRGSDHEEATSPEADPAVCCVHPG